MCRRPLSQIRWHNNYCGSTYVRITFLIDDLVVIFVLTNRILASVVHSEVLDPAHLSKTLDHDRSSAETSIMAPVTATPVTTSITATSVVPQVTLSTNAMGSPHHLTEVSCPGSRTPLRPLVIKSIILTKLLLSSWFQTQSMLFYWLPWTWISSNCQAPQLSLAAHYRQKSQKKDRIRMHSWTIWFPKTT